MFASVTSPSSTRSRKRPILRSWVCPEVNVWMRAKRIRPPMTQAIVMLRWRGSIPPVGVGGRLASGFFGSSFRCHGLRRLESLFWSLIVESAYLQTDSCRSLPLPLRFRPVPTCPTRNIRAVATNIQPRSIAIVGGDLMARSRIESAAAASSLEVQRLSQAISSPSRIHPMWLLWCWISILVAHR